MNKMRLNSAAALSASAILIAAMIIVQAGRLLSGPEVRADLVAATGGFTILTVESSNSNDVALVLEGRSEELMVYKMANQTSLELHSKVSLPRIFSEARGRASGRTK